MKQDIRISKCCKSTQINRYVYGFYIILVIYLAIKGDYIWAFTNLGVALIFDPFDTTVKWEHRPFYQKAWLLGHVTIMLAGLIFIWVQKH